LQPKRSAKSRISVVTNTMSPNAPHRTTSGRSHRPVPPVTGVTQ
jgi:hypothetical protein